MKPTLTFTCTPNGFSFLYTLRILVKYFQNFKRGLANMLQILQGNILYVKQIVFGRNTCVFSKDYFINM
jgi:hypothetical protein